MNHPEHGKHSGRAKGRTTATGEDLFLTTLRSIGDAVIATDEDGIVTFINLIAEQLTGWTESEARGLPVATVFDIVNEHTRARVASPVERSLRDGTITGLANHTVLISKDGRETPIDDSAAPIVHRDGTIQGCVLVFRDVSERRRADRAIRELAGIVESSNDAIIGKDLDGIITSWNPAAERLYGYTAAEALGSPISILAPPEHPNEIPEIMKRLRRGEAIEPYETIRIGKDGMAHDISVTISPIKNQYGETVGASSIARDISPARRATLALRDANELRDTIMESAVFAIAALDLDGRFTLVNRRGLDMSGYAAEELLGRRYTVLLPPEHGDVLDEPFIATIRNGTPLRDVETEIVRKDGGRLLLRFSWTPLYANDRIMGVVGTAEDVTERVDTESRLRAILTSAMDAIISVDEDQRILLFNAAAERMFLCASEQAIGRPLETFIPSRFRERHHDHIMRFGRAGVTNRAMGALGEISGLRSNDEEFPIEASISQVEIRGKRVFTVILRDITERKRLEEQLLQAQKLESVGRLAGGVAHEYNNLLTAIIGFAELALDRAEDPGIAEDLTQIEKAAQRAANLTAQLLAYARKQIVSPKILPINSLIEDVDRILHRLIGENVSLVTRLDPDLGNVRADPSQVTQVLINLAVNARDAMPAGGTLTIATSNATLDFFAASRQREAHPGEYVLLTVADTGEGMTAEVKAHLFEPFFTTKPVGQGTGLGLATCYGIVRQCGGHIAVASEVGAGTTITVYLPRVREAEPQPEPVAKRAAPRGSETILVAEDDPLVRSIVVQTLRQQGYAVLEAETGAIALARAVDAGGRIDLLVSDIRMPGMTGRELGDLLRVQNPATRILLISGYTDDAVDALNDLPPGFQFLPKPFTSSGLAQKVRDVLDTSFTA